MIPWERIRKLMYGAQAVPPPKPKWAESASKEAPPLPVMPKPSVLLKLRGLMGFFLVANVCIGGYLLAKATPRSGKKHRGREKVPAAEVKNTLLLEDARLKPVSHRVVPLREQQQLFNWILEEKRKLKPSSSTEKAGIDEDKRLLKQFLRSDKHL